MATSLVIGMGDRSILENVGVLGCVDTSRRGPISSVSISVYACRTLSSDLFVTLDTLINVADWPKRHNMFLTQAAMLRYARGTTDTNMVILRTDSVHFEWDGDL